MPTDQVFEIQNVVRKVNDAWLKGNVASLSDCFHEDMVIRGPGFQELCRGRAACVKSYEDFLAQANVEEFKEAPATIDVFGSTAIANFEWQMTYQLSGKQYREPGSDTLVLTNERGRWLVLWRLVLVHPGK
jgi:uncharacterized protein (TIGR02246 family)